MDQSAQQQTKVAAGLRSLSEELKAMASGSQDQGMATDLATQASQRAGDLAGWLDQRDPGSLVTEMKQFARQRPGAFLATAAVIGLVGGRLSRSLAADHADDSGSSGVPDARAPIPPVGDRGTESTAYSTTGAVPSAQGSPATGSLGASPVGGDGVGGEFRR